MVDAAINPSQSCFGFEIYSSESFRFLRQGGGQERLQVVQSAVELTPRDETPIFQWTLRDGSGSVTAKLYGGDNGDFYFWTTDAGCYRIDPEARRIDMSPHADAIRHEQRLWGVPTALCVKHHGGLALHAAAVEVGGTAILLAAPGRFGKTTLALACHGHGYRLLTEDTACCSLSAEPLLLPGPTSVRLRPDMFTGEAPAGTTITAIRDDRIHLTLVDGGDGRPVPIGGLVFLRESADEVSLQEVKGSDALRDLWTLSFRFQTAPEHRSAFTRLTRLASSVPVWNLYRPLRPGTLNEVVEQLIAHCNT